MEAVEEWYVKGPDQLMCQDVNKKPSGDDMMVKAVNMNAGNTVELHTSVTSLLQLRTLSKGRTTRS